jgi:hypothetical protein
MMLVAIYNYLTVKCIITFPIPHSVKHSDNVTCWTRLNYKFGPEADMSLIGTFPFILHTYARVVTTTNFVS